MPRPEPPAPSFSLPAPRKPLLSVDINVVTPLFGGGAVAATPDRLQPIRGSSVRGQLRFWWRACKAAGFRDAKDLYEAESKIWGAAAAKEDEAKFGPSAIDIEVEILENGKPIRCAIYERRADGRWQGPLWKDEYPGYVLFPFQGKAGDPSALPAVALEGVRFRLTLKLAPHVMDAQRVGLLAEAEAAIWAWISFGGVGARTRRGCGSLYCGDARFLSRYPLAGWMKEMASRHVVSGIGNPLVPRLTGARLVSGTRVVALLFAWKEAAARWQQFRQRQPGQPRRWPDAPSVRQTLGIGPPQPERSESRYPRADLGLPIIFQRLANPEPRLEGAREGSATRMASPIIVKPLAVSQGEALPIALLLNAPHVWDAETPGVVLVRGGHGRGIAVPRNELEGSEQPARDAFMASVAQAWRANEVRL